MIDGENGWVWPDGTAVPEQVIVLQSQARESVKKGKTQYYSVTDGIENAIAKAREHAGEKNIALHRASAVQQALQAGLLNEIHMSVAHVLLGEGIRLFDHLGPLLSTWNTPQAGDTGSNPCYVPSNEIRPTRVSKAVVAVGMADSYGATRWRFSRLPHLSCMEVLCSGG